MTGAESSGIVDIRGIFCSGHWCVYVPRQLTIYEINWSSVDFFRYLILPHFALFLKKFTGRTFFASIQFSFRLGVKQEPFQKLDDTTPNQTNELVPKSPWSGFLWESDPPGSLSRGMVSRLGWGKGDIFIFYKFESSFFCLLIPIYSFFSGVIGGHLRLAWHQTGVLLCPLPYPPPPAYQLSRYRAVLRGGIFFP